MGASGPGRSLTPTATAVDQLETDWKPRGAHDAPAVSRCRSTGPRHRPAPNNPHLSRRIRISGAGVACLLLLGCQDFAERQASACHRRDDRIVLGHVRRPGTPAENGRLHIRGGARGQPINLRARASRTSRPAGNPDRGGRKHAAVSPGSVGLAFAAEGAARLADTGSTLHRRERSWQLRAAAADLSPDCAPQAARVHVRARGGKNGSTSSRYRAGWRPSAAASPLQPGGRSLASSSTNRPGTRSAKDGQPRRHLRIAAAGGAPARSPGVRRMTASPPWSPSREAPSRSPRSRPGQRTSTSSLPIVRQVAG